MTDINQLLDELQDLVDDKRKRVAKLFADIRASVPRPMTLVFDVVESTRLTSAKVCETPVGIYEIEPAGEQWRGYYGGMVIHRPTESEVVERLQSHFNAEWAEMTAGASNGT